MKWPISKRVSSILFLAVLGLALAVVPAGFRGAATPAAAQIGGGAQACAGAPGSSSISVTPVGTIAGNGVVVVNPNTCAAAAAPAGLSTVSICGTVTQYTAATSSASGTITVGGLLFVIPAGAFFPGVTITVGQPATITAVSSLGQVIGITTAACPATAVPLGITGAESGGAYKLGNKFAD